MSNIIEINSSRFLKELEEQGSIGWKIGQGLFREAYSKDYTKARSYVEEKMKQAGLKTRIDSVGNVFGRLEGTDPNAKTILIGSHLDSVKAGGILDGAYGVMAGLEALRAIKESGILLVHSMELVGFTAEEGEPLGGTFGSRAFTGKMETLPTDQMLNKFNLTKEDIDCAKGNLGRYAAFLEVHIEQGPVLWRRNIPIGIPTAIVGITRYKGLIIGEANHAGTVPMNERKDAMYQTIILLNEWLNFMWAQDNIVCNVGYMNVEPGAITIIPGTVEFGIEIRSTDKEKTLMAVEKLKQIFSKAEICDAKLEFWTDKPAVHLDGNIINAIEEVSQELNINYFKMPSGASHDSSPLARVMPTGMIFVPSVKGISHNKEEFTENDDLITGLKVLTHTILKLDNLCK